MPRGRKKVVDVEAAESTKIEEVKTSKTVVKKEVEVDKVEVVENESPSLVSRGKSQAVDNRLKVREVLVAARLLFNSCSRVPEYGV